MSLFFTASNSERTAPSGVLAGMNRVECTVPAAISATSTRNVAIANTWPFISVRLPQTHSGRGRRGKLHRLSDAPPLRQRDDQEDGEQAAQHRQRAPHRTLPTRDG